MDQPPWLAHAWAEFGVREAAGAAHAPAVLRYFREAGHAGIRDDETPWCAAFAGAMLVRAGAFGTGSLLARSYLSWGQKLDAPRLGAIAVLSRGADPAAGHVGFYLGCDDTRVFLLGGNQSDGVTVEAFDAARLLGYRWPIGAEDAEDEPRPALPPPAHDAEQQAFAGALSHVLDMEGGFSDDPYDPGGPTNKGITLDVFARWQGETVSAVSRGRLIADLRRIPDDTVRDIYLARYWRPAECATFAAPLALMHFDAAVNHGVTGAARILQGALGVTVDGDIGPQTLSALEARTLADILDGYAEARRRRYRALPHFWRFGRGWLRRVDATLRLARAWAQQDGARDPVLEPKQTAKGVHDMASKDSEQDLNQESSTGQAGKVAAPTPGTDDAVPGKWWAESRTVWGTLIAAAATLAPVIGQVLGINLPGEVVQQAGEQTMSAIQSMLTLFGTLLAIYGRTKAERPLVRRSVNLKL